MTSLRADTLCLSSKPSPDPDKPCLLYTSHLLYYTGITRTAKGILEEIVRSMFLNSSLLLGLLEEMKAHALDMAEAIQRNDFKSFGTLVEMCIRDRC